MLIALLTVDAVLKKSLLRNIQRRGTAADSSKDNNQVISSVKGVKLSNAAANQHIMSNIGLQQGSVAATIPKTMSDNIDNTMNNNAAIM